MYRTAALQIDVPRERPAPRPGDSSLRMSEIVAALSYALDLTEGAQPGHALRTCLLGMRIGQEMGLSVESLHNLYYALLLKDAGCSANASRLHHIVGGDEIRAKTFTKTNDWTHFELRQIQFLYRYVHPGQRIRQRIGSIASIVRHSSHNAELLFRLRCDQGAAVVRQIGLRQGTADAIHGVDEHWDGKGYPDRLKGERIPMLSRILSIAQMLEVFHARFGQGAALDCIRRRSGRWFDPDVVRATLSLSRRDRLWNGIASPGIQEEVSSMQRQEHRLCATDQTIDDVCNAFAMIVDAKSPMTSRHSIEVAGVAASLARHLGSSDAEVRMLQRAALLHDVGKLGVPNSILEKPASLTLDEWECVKQHPEQTFRILSRIPTFQTIANVAAKHHEKLDGSGYYRGLTSESLCTPSRLLAMADIYEALTAARPYHRASDPTEALQVIKRSVPHALDAECFQALTELVRQDTFLGLPAASYLPAVESAYTSALMN